MLSVDRFWINKSKINFIYHWSVLIIIKNNNNQEYLLKNGTDKLIATIYKNEVNLTEVGNIWGWSGIGCLGGWQDLPSHTDWQQTAGTQHNTCHRHWCLLKGTWLKQQCSYHISSPKRKRNQVDHLFCAFPWAHRHSDTYSWFE